MPTTPASAVARVGEDGAHARAIAFALPLQALEGLARRFLRGDAHAQLGDRLLRLGPQVLHGRPLGLHSPPALAVSSESWTPVCRRVASSRARASARLVGLRARLGQLVDSRSRRRSS